MGDSADEEVGKDVQAVYVEVDGEEVKGLIEEERSTFLDDQGRSKDDKMEEQEDSTDEQGNPCRASLCIYDNQWGKPMIQ